MTITRGHSPMPRPTARPRIAAALAAATALAVIGSAGAPMISSAAPIATPDLCLAVDATGLPTGIPAAIEEAVAATISARPLVFPAPSVGRSTDGPRTTVVVRAQGDGTAGNDGPTEEAAPDACAVAGPGWSLSVSRDLLQGSAERILASAGLPANVATRITVDLIPDAAVRTTLWFEGDLGVGGTCWVDDPLRIDTATGAAVAGDELHQDLHFLAPQDACTRFRAFMPDGGAGQLAVRLVPALTGTAGDTVRLATDRIEVGPDGVVLTGSIIAP